MSAWLHWTPLSPKSSILTFLHCPLWSSVSELSEVLFPRLRTSFCPRKNLSGKSYVAHVHAQYGTLCNRLEIFYHMFSTIQSLSHVQLFVTPWTAACQASLSIINSVRNQCYLSSIVGGKKIESRWIPMSSIFSLKGVKETKVHIPLRHTYLHDLPLDFLGPNLLQIDISLFLIFLCDSVILSICS